MEDHSGAVIVREEPGISYQPLLDSSRKESSEGVTMAFGDAEKIHTSGRTKEDIYKRRKVKSHSEDSGH